jgi:hypothetical protein
MCILVEDHGQRITTQSQFLLSAIIMSLPVAIAMLAECAEIYRVFQKELYNFESL